MLMAASPPLCDPRRRRHAILVMGVSGCGKSSVAARLSISLGFTFVEGDNLHPAANVDKMARGIALGDEDRWPWLDAIGNVLSNGLDLGVVISCSALKLVYRERLRQAADGILPIVSLHGSRAVLMQRMSARRDHFMPPTLLDSQLAALEVPTAEPGVITIDIDQPLDIICDLALRGLGELAFSRGETR